MRRLPCTWFHARAPFGAGGRGSFLKPLSRKDDDINYGDRMFHIEIMRGGMNRLLLRSNPDDQKKSRVEILFMNVKFMKDRDPI